MAQDLFEVMPFQYSITESAGGRLRVEGVFQRSDVKNQNGRIYPRSIFEKVLNERGLKESLENRSMFGELDHPQDGKTKLSRVSHIVTDLQLQPDGTVIGVAEVLDNTPNGAILRALFEANTQVGISSRGSGSVNGDVVAEDFKLNTFDFVARPSTPGAWPTPSRGSFREETSTSSTPTTTLEDQNFEAFLRELDNMHSPQSNINEVSHDVILANNWLKEHGPYLNESELYEVVDVLNLLNESVTELAEQNPGYIMQDLRSKMDESFGLVLNKHTPMEEDKEDSLMDRKQFIKDRLNEAFDDSDAQGAEHDELAAEIDEMSDEELADLAFEVGLLGEEDAEVLAERAGEDDEDMYEEEDDENMLYDDSALDEEELVEYVGAIESRLGEATELIAELAGALEESGSGDSDLAIKYEAALGIIQETVTQYQLLQEAVGGEERANGLIESYLDKLEKGTAVTADEQGDTDDDGGTQTVESFLNEDGGSINKEMLRAKQLAESVVAKQGLH